MGVVVENTDPSLLGESRDEDVGRRKPVSVWSCGTEVTKRTDGHVVRMGRRGNTRERSDPSFEGTEFVEVTSRVESLQREERAREQLAVSDRSRPLVADGHGTGTHVGGLVNQEPAPTVRALGA